jgi:nicotinamidase-related amidase
MADFSQQLEKVSAFFNAENLAAQNINYAGEIALLVIDVQKTFCDPDHYRGNAETAEVAKRIKSIVPEFRKAGIPVYAVYFSIEEKQAPQIDFYEFTPEADDVLIRKNLNSAFSGGKLKDILQKDQRKLLLTCGFNLNACVYQTAVDAVKEEFEVCVLRDLTGNDNNHRHEKPEDFLTGLRYNGIAIEQSGKVLDLIGGLTR